MINNLWHQTMQDKLNQAMNPTRRIHYALLVPISLAILGLACQWPEILEPHKTGHSQMKNTPIPDKTVVLTFDDAVRSHLTVAAPLLKAYGFNATFFVSHAWMDDTANFLSWDDIAQLDHMGFVIGNHTWNHVALHEPNAPDKYENEIHSINAALEQVGVPRPVSFSWPGNHFGPEMFAELRRHGMRFARRGPQPEPPVGPVAGMGPLYDPNANDPLLIPTSGLAVPGWTLDDFKQVVARAHSGKIVVLQFHGVPDVAHPQCSTPPERFAQFMAWLKQEGYHVIAMRDLEQFVKREPAPDDPLTHQRFFR